MDRQAAPDALMSGINGTPAGMVISVELFGITPPRHQLSGSNQLLLTSPSQVLSGAYTVTGMLSERVVSHEVDEILMAFTGSVVFAERVPEVRVISVPVPNREEPEEEPPL